MSWKVILQFPTRTFGLFSRSEEWFESQYVNLDPRFLLNSDPDPVLI